MPSDVYVASFGAGFSGTTHGIRPGWRYDRIADARTWCGIPGSFGIRHNHSGKHVDITCRNCGKSGHRFRELSINVDMRRYYVLSDETETWETDTHWTHSEKLEWDEDAREDYPDPVDWAVAILRNAHITQTPLFAGFPDLHPSGSPILAVQPHEWLGGTADDSYTTEQTEWSVRLPSEWSSTERTTVFQRVTSYR